MKIIPVLKGLNIIDCCEGFVINATSEEVGAIYMALRTVEDIFPETESAPDCAALVKTIKAFVNGTDDEVHKPDYSYESELLKRASDTNTNAPGSKSHMLRPPCEQCPDWCNCKDGCLYEKPKR